MKDEEQMTIREMCEHFNVTARTLRFYETKELLSPLREGQKRLYTNRDRVRLKLILRGKRFGFDLEKIRQILNLYDMGDAGQAQLAASVKVAKERFNELTGQRDELKLALKELASLIEWGEHKIQSQAAATPNAA
ncbi:MerR family transcriptional regulator [Marinosulfonomonas sp. PRT-SC04]|nr:MerR family transcriptional regulator [Marinosulfonomonas sp. PRT-SC04]